MQADNVSIKLKFEFAFWPCGTSHGLKYVVNMLGELTDIH